MRKIAAFVLTLSMLFACTFSFTSCSNQIEDGTYRYAECDAEWVDEINGSQKQKLAEYHGFENKKDYIDDKKERVSTAFIGSSFTFDNDGTGKFTLANQTESFKWEQDGNEVDITFESAEATEIFGNTDFEISFGKLVAEVHDVEYDYALTIILIYKLK